MYKKSIHKFCALIVSLLLFAALPFGLVACVEEQSNPNKGPENGSQIDTPAEEVGGVWNENWD